MKKTVAIVLSLLFFSTFSFSNELILEDSVKTFRQAQKYYELNEYGKALKFSEDAILYKKMTIENELSVLKASLSPRRVQAVGSKIDDVLRILNTRGEFESIKIINNYIKKKGVDFFDNDINKLIAFISSNSEYPEAQKLIGDIYLLEGEYEFAENYYLMALDNQEILDIPDEKYEILYMLAELSKLKGDENQMETRLLNVLVDDEYFMDKALFDAMLNTIKTNKKESVEKLFTLYRSHSYYCLNAYNQLTEYYLNQGESEKALRFSAISCITGFTRINEILISRNIDYEYSNLNEFLQEVNLYSDLIDWGTNNDVWKSFNELAKIAMINGFNNFSESLLHSIAQYTPDVYWQKNAVLQLSYFEY